MKFNEKYTEELFFVMVNEKYSDYLRKYDKKIREKEKRPYIGIVLQIKEKQYFAPLSSPKEKYRLMKEQMDLIKLKNGKLGVINLNNMIPVISNNLYIEKIKLNDLRKSKIEKERRYYFLLKEQHEFRIQNKEKILKKAEKVYETFTKEKSELTKREKFISKRVIDFKLMEK
ncbi:MAG: type III toxin-antitoxin system ToxN/AbiQ family toxin, partial [Pseudoleptotrichia goodfellowii]|nr:type III toxin-antitoxin system ToxN/AbiQ family toxin [Pseudoleptotrichia goodfellowii]